MYIPIYWSFGIWCLSILTPQGQTAHPNVTLPPSLQNADEGKRPVQLSLGLKA